MTTNDTSLTIQQAAHATGLTVHTLRYYERIGLLLPVDRAANGHRRYSPAQINLINLLNRWRKTGMSLSDIKRYVQLLEQGDSTAAERRAMLEAHRTQVQQQIDDLQATLDTINFKIQNYHLVEERLKQMADQI
jgi:DNA-binding transcriptional MerR regulator